MIAKPKPIRNDVIDQWHLDCWEAEKAQQDAIDALNNCPLDAEDWHELRDKANATNFKLNEILDQLPGSDPDDRTVAQALKSIKDLDVKQAAKCINRYLHSRPNIKVVSYDVQFELNRYEWTVEKLVRYIVKGDVISHREIIGKIHIEQPADGTMVAGKMIKLTLGYGMGDGETKIINGYLLADVHRKCAYACADLADNIAKAEAEAEAEAKEAEAAGKSIFTKKNRDEAKEYWRKIPHNKDDQEIVRLWNKGLTAPRIAEEIKKTQSHVNNRIRVLREEYPKYVLTNKARKLFNFRDKS